jgi:serine/threonine-protein kinase
MLLYRLLSGHHPGGSGGLDVTRCIEALVDEPRRMSSVVADRREPFQVLEQHAARRSTTPDALRRRLRGDLDAIVAKALRKRPHDRYVSVTAYAEDVRRSLGGQPVLAQPGAFHSRLRQFIRPLRPR